MTNWYEYEVKVILKTLRGSFGSKRQRHNFCFCAQSADDARSLASSSVKAKGHPFDEKYIEVVSATRIVFKEREALPLVHPPLQTLREAHSTRSEEAA